jgi:hypothetical protein
MRHRKPTPASAAGPTLISMTTQPLPDRWSTRDLPVLLETARVFDAGADVIQSHTVAAAMNVQESEIQKAWHALAPTYLHANDFDPGIAGPPDLIATGLTERGRRAAGLWPSGEAADALVEALRQAEELVDDPEEKSLIRRAGGAIGSVSRDVMVDIMGAVIARQSGIG